MKGHAYAGFLSFSLQLLSGRGKKKGARRNEEEGGKGNPSPRGRRYEKGDLELGLEGFVGLGGGVEVEGDLARLFAVAEEDDLHGQVVTRGK